MKVACTLPAGLAIPLAGAGHVTLKGPARDPRDNGRQVWPAHVNTIVKPDEVAAVERWLAQHRDGPLGASVYLVKEEA